jgi:hypothetical protein
LKNTLKTKHKKGITKSSTSIPAFMVGRNWVGLLKNTLKTKRKEGITKSSTSLNPTFIVEGLGGTVEKYSKKRKEGNHKRQHITQSLLFIGGVLVGLLKYSFMGRNWVGLLKILLRPNVKKNHKEQHITQSLLS